MTIKQAWLPEMVVMVWWLAAVPCMGQADSIFGIANPEPPVVGIEEPLTAAKNASGAAATNLAEDSHPVVRSLRRSPPKTAIELSRAILFMLRIERWDEVSRYLDQLAKLALDEATALKMTRAVGLETWLRLGGAEKKLSPEQQATIRKIIDLSSGAVRNPATLQQAIDLLRSSELVDRKRGVLAVQASGESGLAALLETIANSEQPPTPIMSEAIITMQAEGEAALKAAINATEGKARDRLLTVAARIPGRAYMAELMASLFLMSPESDVYKGIRKILAPTGQALPTALASQRYILDQMNGQLKEFVDFRRDPSPGIHSVWRWSTESKRLQTELDNDAGLHLERAYQFARLANQLAPHSEIDSALATAVILERNYRLLPLIDLEEAAFQQSFQPRSKIDNLDYLGLVWDAARQADLPAGQLRSVQAIGMALKKTPAAAGGSIGRLAMAVKDSAPPIRYTAAFALSQRSDLATNFAGRHAYEQTKLEMQRLESKPLALIVGGSSELRDSLSNHLSLLGIRALYARNARETMRLIQEPQPIEYAFIVDRVSEMSLSELVQRLRSHPRTSSVPMAVMTEQMGLSQRAVLAEEGFENIHYSAVTANLDFTLALVNEMRERSPMPMMDSIDRVGFQALFAPATHP